MPAPHDVIAVVATALAGRPVWPYLEPGTVVAECRNRVMTLRNSEPESLSPLRQRTLLPSAIVVGGLVIGAGALVGGVVLWARYGTAIFFEMIASGIAACF